MKPQRMVVISDLHCGSFAGLTPPRWWYGDQLLKSNEAKGAGKFVAKVAKNQRELWRWYTEAIASIRPVDCFVCNGDAIDGSCDIAKGTESNTGDRSQQAEMAAECLDYIGAKRCGIIYGTRRHTGWAERWENVMADKLKTNVMFIGGAKQFKLKGSNVVFNVKHKISKSSVPHGKATAIERQKLWAALWANTRKQQTMPNWVIRSHVHYYMQTYDSVTNAWGVITPAMQGYGTSYGEEECEGIVDVGFLYFDVYKDEAICHPLIAEGLAQLKRPLCDL